MSQLSSASTEAPYEDTEPSTRRTGDDVAQETEPRPSFGWPELNRAYAILAEAVMRYDLGRLFETAVNADGSTSVTICRTWRLIKRPSSPRVRCLPRVWSPEQPWEGCLWPTTFITLLPCDPKPDIWQSLYYFAVWHLAEQYTGANDEEREVLSSVRRDEQDWWLIVQTLIKYKQRELERRLGTHRLNSLAGTLSKIIWRRIIDPGFIKVVAYARMFKPVLLSDYIDMSQSHEAYTRMHLQDRRYLTLSRFLDKEEVESVEPFSIERWTVKGVKLTVGGSVRLVRLSSPASYRAMIGTHPAIVRDWAENSIVHTGFATYFDLLAKLGDETPIPQPILRSLESALGSPHHFWMYRELDIPLLSNLVRQYVRECKRRKAMPEYRTYSAVLASINLLAVLDWFSTEGTKAGEPNARNTWAGIERKSHAWHEHMWQASATSHALAWNSALEACVMGGGNVVPLTTSKALFAEGRVMHNCVSTYDEYCASGRYRMFSLVLGAERATLGIEQVGDCWKLDQVVGMCNGSVSPQMEAVAQEVARLYLSPSDGTGPLSRQCAREE